MTAKSHSDFRETVGRFQDAVLASPALKPRDKVVALVMLGRVNREMFRGLGELLTWASVESVAGRCRLSTRDVERARSALLAVGVIERDRPGGRGQATRMRFRLDWLEREDAFADTGVADAGVGQNPDLATEPSSLADTTRAFCPTRESPKPCDITREPTREGARASGAAAGGLDLHAQIAQRIGKVQHANWFRNCQLTLTSDRALIVTAPTRFQADTIRQNYADELRGLFPVRAVEVRVAKALPPGVRDLWSPAEGRA
ncbi:DnaA N-terminal domain-containing protein [Azospirillum doebereinerae]|uniref:DnaA N-terminal domain-containing protein n=1 Tax=Azospirillum doebereinerae TaxID=92933 RepID=A0A433J2W0_9PROT|nr:DnaA N-terminal domain-containing protein [Azospirillum doebereinerae]RUQ66019.1 hypothetical protein EJ913_24590 [Azospirillum doebereinerae]